MKRLAVLLLALPLLLFTNAANNNGYEVGDYAKDFNLKNVDGSIVSLSDYDEAKGFIVVFTCNHCPYAKMYEDRIIQLNKDYEAKGYPVVAIQPNDPEQVPEDSFENMKKRAEEKNYGFPYLMDETQEVTKRFGATRTPHVYILNKEKSDKLKVAYIGTIDNNYKNAEKADQKYVRNAVNALLQGEEVPEKHTKAIGCTIKWKDS